MGLYPKPIVLSTILKPKKGFNTFPLLSTKIKMQGSLAVDFIDRFTKFLEFVLLYIKERKFISIEDIVKCLHNKKRVLCVFYTVRGLHRYVAINRGPTIDPKAHTYFMGLYPKPIVLSTILKPKKGFNTFPLLSTKIKMQGFLAVDFIDRFTKFLEFVLLYIKERKFISIEDIVK
ncbi:hypothetical protein IGI04_015329 [Brassica rapa subsp. trilocularis]|uniref:Uncharacterized protein n=1 Tax=Brassica rapa subsp. trilocularis TaxID=1813537 RepID=A0ABQ7MPU5_BRACM|nr:hypothetical protein IGI04_015329 [Brassica rapa subsp. trilocularis]